MAFDATIYGFRGQYFFLSNYYPASVTYRGVTYKNSEAAFQAQKEPKRDSEFCNLDPSAAKKLGRSVNLRANWDDIKDRIMLEVVYLKFSQNEDLKKKLLDTGDSRLVEANTWGDSYWGYDEKLGSGQNKLGQILMRVRDRLKDKERQEKDPYIPSRRILYETYPIYKLVMAHDNRGTQSVVYVEADSAHDVVARYIHYLGICNVYPFKPVSIRRVDIEEVEADKFIKYNRAFTEMKKRTGD